jgi:threonine/homoserine efflux transporter RhtA
MLGRRDGHQQGRAGGVAAGALVLGERLDPRQWVGAFIVLAAILAILRQPSTRPVEAPATAIV